jgi:hypothetical protein
VAPVRGNDLADLFRRGRLALGGSHRDVAEQIASSKRTVERWYAGETRPPNAKLAALARLVYPRDPALAAEIAAAIGQTPLSLGVATRTGPTLAHLLDAVVCVAAETIDVTPRSLRPALHAAFKRVRELGLSLEDVERGLAPTDRTNG